MPYLGVDGGGTKTEFMLIDNSGNILSYNKQPSIDYKRIGRKNFEDLIKKSIKEILLDAKIKIEDIRYSFWGIPCFGDELNSKDEDNIQNIIKSTIKTDNFKLGNDAEAGWAGSLGCKEGINLVAGTGAIGFGIDQKGNKARASGWGHILGDEGSAYWLGKELLSTFTKESDGRKKKTILYSLVRKKLSIVNDYEIINLITDNNDFGRKEVARLALILYKAAKKDDIEAIKIFKKAAYELSEIVKTVVDKLDFDPKQEVVITYSGGVFNAGDYILKPLRNQLSKINVLLKKPLLSPVSGAALYAILLFTDKYSYNDLLNNLMKQEGDAILNE